MNRSMPRGLAFRSVSILRMRSWARCRRAASRRPFQLVRYMTAACTSHAAGGQANTGSTRTKCPRTEYVPGGCRVTCAGACAGGEVGHRCSAVGMLVPLACHASHRRASGTGAKWTHPCREREDCDEDGAGVPQDQGADA